MKTKELIRQLQEADPEGEAEVCVGNRDIWFLEHQPAYYDGRLEIIDRTPQGKVVRGIITSRGNKVQIRTLSIAELLSDHPETPVELEVGNMDREDEYTKLVEEWRAEGRAWRAHLAAYEATGKWPELPGTKNK